MKESNKKIDSKNKSQEEVKETNKEKIEKLEEKENFYITTANETPMMIARRFHLDVDEICRITKTKWNRYIPENTKIKL